MAGCRGLRLNRARPLAAVTPSQNAPLSFYSTSATQGAVASGSFLFIPPWQTGSLAVATPPPPAPRGPPHTRALRIRQAGALHCALLMHGTSEARMTTCACTSLLARPPSALERQGPPCAGCRPPITPPARNLQRCWHGPQQRGPPSIAFVLAACGRVSVRVVAPLSRQCAGRPACAGARMSQ